ncbi:MAG TPA: GGDEF domain-containing protein [Bryobacteraceae bacterium]|jgi:GGDEF domain-containing protein|nr:GGDEF domain-containing protein [Bryobacteraceae bacterium]
MESEQPTGTTHASASAYLATVAAMADCVGRACPEVGVPFRQRLHRLRSRLAFNVTPESLEKSATLVARELEEYASKASHFLYQQSTELRATTDSFEAIVQRLAQRQEFYSARLRQFATQMQVAAYPSDPAQLEEVVALQVAGLLSVVESLNNEARSLVAQMQNQLAASEQRLAEATITDPDTGLMNRLEMERHLAARRAAGVEPVLLHITLGCETTPDVTRQVAEKLVAQFRPSDRVSRWSPTEFLVLFDGTVEIAERRGPQVVAWIAGSYDLPDGTTEDVTVELGLLRSAELVESV